MHDTQPLVRRGAALVEARVVVVMLHGRGSNPAGILALTSHVDVPQVAFLAPAAEHGSWYPQRFLRARADNEPSLSSALATVDQVLEEVSAAGIPTHQIMLLGFSQGACLALEYAARHPQRYGGIVGLSGGLIGSDEEVMNYVGSLAGTPVFLGCSDTDEHIPLARVRQAARMFEKLDAIVTERIYPNFGHTINMDEVAHINTMLAILSEGSNI